MLKSKSRKKPAAFPLRFRKKENYRRIKAAAKISEDSINKFIERAAVKAADIVIAAKEQGTL